MPDAQECCSLMCKTTVMMHPGFKAVFDNFMKSYNSSGQERQKAMLLDLLKLSDAMHKVQTNPSP
jgi:hypothetical protein